MSTQGSSGERIMMFQFEEMMKIFVVLHCPSPRKSILLVCIPVQREIRERDHKFRWEQVVSLVERH